MKSGLRKNLALAVAITIVLLLSYVLSIGPAIKLWSMGLLPRWSEPVFETIYTPMRLLADASPTFNEFVEWYMHVWGIR